jgi:hypothetical protein
MRKSYLFLFLALFLCGCSTYRYNLSEDPAGAQGYVALRNNYKILEYTSGKDNSLPGLEVARERLSRRHGTVEHYYKKMGIIQNNFRQFFWEPPRVCISFIVGLFRLPFIAAAEHKYEHNAQYRQKVDKLEEERDIKEAARINGLKQQLQAYLEKDLGKEAIQEARPVKKLIKETSAAKKEAKMISRQQAQEKALDRVEEKLQQPTPQATGPVIAVITARPLKGFSPLRVCFSAGKSHSSYGKVTSYEWDFGDGDTASGKKVTNTYFSATYGAKFFTVTLTVKDEKGNTAVSNTTVEVTTK